MFTVISRYNSKNLGMKGKFSEKIFKKKIVAYLVKERDIFFVNAVVRRTVTEKDYKKIVRYAGGYAKNIILADNVKIDTTLREYRKIPELFFCTTAVNTATALLRDININANKLNCLYIDIDGSLNYLPEKLIPYCLQVKVITKNPEKYAVVSRKCYAEFGATFVITDNAKEVGDYDIIVAPKGIGEIEVSDDIPIFVASEKYAYDNKRYIYDYWVDVDDYSGLEVDGVNPMMIIAMCYEMFGDTSLENMVAVYFTYDCKKCTIQQLSDKIIQAKNVT